MGSERYTMKISLNVLNHLGINLYSNVPAVISEVIANSWDAGATRVNIDFDFNEQAITISDNGCGMNEEDINNRYLYVGYQRRERNQETPKNREPMGRKGLGKLSLFSIANKIDIYSRKNEQESAFRMSAEGIKDKLDNENPEKIEPYHPETIDFDRNILIHTHGTAIQIKDLKKKITKSTADGLKKRIARRFSIFGEEFEVKLDGEIIKYTDRDYFHKARFLFHYGEDNISKYCHNLDKYEDGDNMVFDCAYQFDEDGNSTESGPYEIKGWIGIAHHSNDLDDQNAQDEKDDNLNNIAVLIRGKVAQEDILHEFRMGALITKYMYGEIQADFLDEDEKEDIATSGRQKIVEDTPRYQALKKFLNKQLLKIRTKTDSLKKNQGVKKAIENNYQIEKWYNGLGPDLKSRAREIFGKMEQINIDEAHRATLYSNAILAFEKMKMKNTLDKLAEVEPGNLEGFLSVYESADIIEAEHYYEIVTSRLSVIEELERMIKENDFEKAIQKYIFNHLWLLDPAWERATSEAELEKTIYEIIENEKEKESKKVTAGRVDIQYRTISGVHVIIELKRANRRLSKTALENQINKYIIKTRQQLDLEDREYESVEGICLVGKLPGDWSDKDIKKAEIESLKPLNIRIITYGKLIRNARLAYKKFIKKRKKVGKIRKLLEDIGKEAS